MMRVEEIVKEADIVHEMETYNELLGGAGEIGTTLLIEMVINEVSCKLEPTEFCIRSLFFKLSPGGRPIFKACLIFKDSTFFNS